ncbi:tail tube GTA-gp10-like protein [Rhizobium subbaraonis]|uniref:Tail tube GTA-gp10-like protein n=1 Tax=Rhizobium subbaraonis TaxID=908946 RepID=A0A285U0Z8_9HYPH|nr:gene transfer agent family protein [Rhizobium subbaraonis]SOC35604.1 tail tube GTA-gp10-like protein [Rhizobium subbaraonis]
MTGRANRRRGEIEAVLDGERRILCLTLGALAELETAFAIDSLNELAARFSRGAIGAHDIIRIVGAGLRGGGNLYSDEDVAAMTAEGGIQGFARIVAELLSVTFAPPGSENGSREAGGTSVAAAGDATRNPPPPHPGNG